MCHIWLFVISVVLVLIGSGGTLLRADDHVIKHKTGQYRKINQQQLQKLQQNCQPDKYISQQASNNEILFTNCEGKQLWGKLDNLGYGELRDEEGNVVKVQPGQASMASDSSR